MADLLLAVCQRGFRPLQWAYEKRKGKAIMKYTSSEANKLLRRLNEERDAVLVKEQKSSTFLAAMGEDPESVRPEYDYIAVQNTVAKLDQKIRTVKHAINQFNLTQTVPGFDMTVDQILVYIPQLTARKNKLSEMKNRLPKQRETSERYGHISSVIDYVYTNYDIDAAEADYYAASDELAKAQAALDTLNNTVVMEIDV